MHARAGTGTARSQGFGALANASPGFSFGTANGTAPLTFPAASGPGLFGMFGTTASTSTGALGDTLSDFEFNVGMVLQAGWTYQTSVHIILWHSILSFVQCAVQYAAHIAAAVKDACVMKSEWSAGGHAAAQMHRTHYTKFSLPRRCCIKLSW